MTTTTGHWMVILAILLTALRSLSAAVAVERVWPDKMIYSPGASASLEVGLTNTAASAEDVIVVFDLLSELDSKEEIGRQKVTIAPAESKKISFQWNTGRRDYGHGAR